MEAAFGACLQIMREQPVGQPLEAGAEFLVLQLLDHAAIGESELDAHRSGEAGILMEEIAHHLCRNHQDAARRKRAGRFQVDAVQQHGGDDEALAGPQHRHGRLAITVGREHLDLSIDDDMQEIRRLSLAHQLHMCRETLEKRHLEHRIDMGRGRAVEDGQPPHLQMVLEPHWQILPDQMPNYT
jgi:hypothetical protein